MVGPTRPVHFTRFRRTWGPWTGRDRTRPAASSEFMRKETEHRLSVAQAGQSRAPPPVPHGGCPSCHRPQSHAGLAGLGLRAAWGSGPAALAKDTFHKRGRRSKGTHGKAVPLSRLQTARNTDFLQAPAPTGPHGPEAFGRQKRRHRHSVLMGANANPKKNSRQNSWVS